MSAGSHLRLPQALASLGQSAAPIGPIFDEERARGGRPSRPGVDRVQAPPLCDGQARHLVRVGAEDHRHIRSSQCPQLRSHEAAPVAQAAGVRHVNRKARDGLGALQERRPLHATVACQRLKGRRQARRHCAREVAPISAVLARCLEYISRSHPTMFLLAVRNFSPSPSLSLAGAATEWAAAPQLRRCRRVSWCCLEVASAARPPYSSRSNCFTALVSAMKSGMTGSLQCAHHRCAQ